MSYGRDNLVRIAKETLAIIEKGTYNVGDRLIDIGVQVVSWNIHPEI